MAKTRLVAARRKLAARLTAKAPTGIHGFDEITAGGLPRARNSVKLEMLSARSRAASGADRTNGTAR